MKRYLLLMLAIGAGCGSPVKSPAVDPPKTRPSAISQRPVEIVRGPQRATIVLTDGDGCGITAGSDIWCWGRAEPPPNVSAAAKPLTKLVARGSSQLCAIGRDGLLFCEQRRDGTGATQLELVAELGEVVDVAASSGHICAATREGRVMCWGSNLYAELGTGDRTAHDKPVRVAGIADAVAVYAADELSCALHASGHVSCWGSNPLVGDPRRTRPSRVEGIDTALQFGGGGRPCVVASSKPRGGRVACWTPTNYMAADFTEPSFLDELVAPATAVAMSSALLFGHACAVTSAGRVRCGGGNHRGQLGTGNTEPTMFEKPVVGIAHAREIVSSGSTACVRDGRGNVHCWGSINDYRGKSPRHGTIPQRVEGVPASSSVSCSSEHCCALTRSAEAYCWGTARNFITTPPVPPGKLEDATKLIAWTGQPRRLPFDAVDAVSTPWRDTWVASGQNVNCIGHCAYRGEQAPFATVKGTTGSLRTGNQHGCTIDRGALSCVGPETWGDEWGPQCTQTGANAFGANPSLALPTWNPMPELHDVVAFGMGGSYFAPLGCAATNGGPTYCWGSKMTLARTGMGITLRSVDCEQAPAVEVAIPKGHRLTQVSAGTTFACGIDATSRVWCWGANDSGQLGRGIHGAPLPPAIVPNLKDEDVKAIDASDHVCAVVTNGDVYCWGASGSGQLGDGQVAPPNTRKRHFRATPVRVAGLPEPMVGVTTGGESTCAWSRAGSIYCWGSNQQGQLGRGHTIFYATATPTRITELSPAP